MLLMVAALQALDPGPVPLWGGLTAGMSYKEVRAVQPKSYVSFGPDCGGMVEYKFERKGLTSVHIDSYADRTSSCGILIEKSLHQKYGEPQVNNTAQRQSNCTSPGTYGALCRSLGGQNLKTDTAVVWVQGKTRITYTSLNGEMTMIDYAVEPEVTEKSSANL